MPTRIRYQTVAFPAPFRVAGMTQDVPAGSYEVATEEELLENLATQAYRRISTTIRVPMGAASYQVFELEPGLVNAPQAGQAPGGQPAASDPSTPRQQG